MPTGYTAGIIDGKIKDFSTFAKNCIRAFGAAIHMRDDSMDKPYEPREISPYHLDEMNKEKLTLRAIRAISDNDLIDAEKKTLLDNIARYEVLVQERKDIFERLNTILLDAEDWNAPTKEHEEFKKFMVQQLTDTIKWDADPNIILNKLNKRIAH